MAIVVTDTTTTPDFTGFVNRDFFIAAQGGPQHPQNYLDRFPDALYNKNIDSHLVKFMYALLGPAGIGWLRKNYLNARLILEDFGLEAFDLDRFYANPLGFGRILEEVYDEDPRGLLQRGDWETLRAKDAKYRNRAVDYVMGVRAGNTPLGMYLVARSGLGHEVEVIENYRYLYDIHSDDYLGLPYYGKTASTEEMIVLPRREISTSEVQIITMEGSPTGGFFQLFFPVGNETTNSTQQIAYNATNSSIQQFLDAVPSIGPHNTQVTGGPLPDNPIRILFTGDLSAEDVPQLQAINLLTGGTGPQIKITTERSGNGAVDEVVSIAPRDQRYARDALERIKPVTAILSFGDSAGLRSAQTWNTIYASSEYQEVVRYVTGQTNVPWPERSDRNWIEGGVEHEARRSHNDLQHHYRGFHNVAATYAYTETALTNPNYSTDIASTLTNKSEHIGPFAPVQRFLFPVLNATTAVDYQYTSEQALADYSEPLTVSVTADDVGDTTRPLVNGVYPIEWQTLPGVPQLKYKNEQFWASLERTTGSEYLEIDLGAVRAINYLVFEATEKPFDIQIDYDILDGSPAREYRPVQYKPTIPSTLSVSFNGSFINKWFNVQNYVSAGDGTMIYTRFLRITFTRRNDFGSPFRKQDGTSEPYSIEVRNLRVGRNVS